jgi:hypothetical protein
MNDGRRPREVGEEGELAHHHTRPMSATDRFIFPASSGKMRR